MNTTPNDSGNTSSTAAATPDSIDAALRLAAIERPAALALTDPPNRSTIFHGTPNRLTWRELDNAVSNLAASLRELGAGAQAPVAIQLPNVVELVVGLLACARAGAIAVPFPIQHRQHELSSGLSSTRAGVLLTGARPDRPDQLETAADVIDGCKHTVQLAVVGPVGSSQGHPLALNTAEPLTSFVPHSPTSTETTTICWTSGTTGLPKGVPRTGAMWLASGRFQVEQLELTSDDQILCPFPVVNMAGIGGMVVPWVLVGAALHLHQPLDLPVFLQQLTAEGVTYTVAPPPLLNMLLANDEILAGVDLSRIRKISSGSAPLDPWMVEGWDQRGIEIVNVFGSNEGAAMLSTKAAVPDPTQRARYFPEPSAPGVRVRLVDPETGLDITEPGNPGELRFAGPTVFDGYLDSSGEEFDQQGFYRTGDVFEWVNTAPEARLLRFVDRAKDIIIRGGMNISAAELEGLISSHGSVAECAAVAVPDATLGERVGIFAVASPEETPTLEVLVEHLQGIGIASYKLPERLELIEALPRNPVGKVTKEVLRKRWEAV